MNIPTEAIRLIQAWETIVDVMPDTMNQAHATIDDLRNVVGDRIEELVWNQVRGNDDD